MKKYLSIIILSCVFVWANAQQRPQFSQYANNTYIQNPAVTGAYDYIDLRLGYRNQWTGFEDAPRTIFLSGHTPFKLNQGGATNKPLPTIGSSLYNPHKKGEEQKEEKDRPNLRLRQGVGGLLLYDQTGPNSRMMAYVSYALHIPVAQKFYLALGLQGGIINYSQDFSKLDPLNTTQIDNALQDGTINSLQPDLGAGLMLYNEKFYIGISSAQMLGSTLSFSDVQTNELFRHYFIQAGYRLEAGQVSFVPFVLMKMLEASPASFDLGFRSFLFQERLSLGLGYRGLRFSGGDESNGIQSSLFREDAAFALIGFNLNKMIDINYSFDYTFSSLSSNRFNPMASNSHEISIGVKLKNEKNKQRLF